MSLSIDEKQSIINYRIERSYQSLKEAKDNALMENWNLSVNRLYYATFYMALALNLSNGNSAKTHNGVYSIFCKQYINNNMIDKELGSLYRKLYSMRQSGDYDDMFDWTEDDVLPLIPLTETLIKTMHSLL